MGGQPKTKLESYNNLGGINIKSSPYATGPQEFLEIKNFDFSSPGSLTKRWGSTQFIGATLSGTVASTYEFERLNGESYVILSANTNIFRLSGGTPVSFRSSLLNNGIFDFVTFVDRLFATNGQDFFKYDGNQSTFYSLPAPMGLTFSQGVSVGSGISGRFIFSYGYKNDRSYFGPQSNGVTIAATSVTSLSFSGFTLPGGYGISALVLYASENNLTTRYRVLEFPSNTATLTINGFTLTNQLANDNLWFTMAPFSQEIYNNQLFLGGFSAALSTVYFSDIAEPEAVGATAFFEVRTNDGDRITNLKNYYSQLIVFKERSFHALTGDNPANFSLRQISDQYGCVSKRAAATYEDKCIFLDQKGLVGYNGANVEIISNRVESYFTRMNVNAARTQAQVLHVKQRNEIWTAIPCDGATLNNCVIVYDYLSNAYTVFDGFQPASLAIAKANLDSLTPFYGDYSGRLNYFGASLMGDNQAGITCLFQTSQYSGEGFSVEKLWRRLFLDSSYAVGSTGVININFLVNNGSSLALTRTFGTTQFQSRIDYGLSSKSMSFVLSNSTNNAALTISGFTIEYRFQRAV